MKKLLSDKKFIICVALTILCVIALIFSIVALDGNFENYKRAKDGGGDAEYLNWWKEFIHFDETVTGIVLLMAVSFIVTIYIWLDYFNIIKTNPNSAMDMSGVIESRKQQRQAKQREKLQAKLNEIDKDR